MKMRENFSPREIDEDAEFEARRELRRKRRQEQIRRQRKKQQMIRWAISGIVLLLILILMICFVKNAYTKHIEEKRIQSEEKEKKERQQALELQRQQEEIQEQKEALEEAQEAAEKKDYRAKESENMQSIPADVVSSYAVVIDANSNEIVAMTDPYARISPASMTKILTVLVAAEHIDDLNDTFTMTTEITDYGYVNDCSSAGFLDQEVVTVKDLLYGTILPSGADAAVGLAVYVAGSQEAFVDMMNEKLVELSLQDTSHMTNCVGIYNDNHYSTVYDMAVILQAAMDNDICREVLGSRVYTTSVTKEHPEGIILSNWFLRRIEDKDTGCDVIGAKTGFVVQSGSCAASMGASEDGRQFICVTGNSTSSWRCIYDHVAIYSQFFYGKVADVSSEDIPQDDTGYEGE